MTLQELMDLCAGSQGADWETMGEFPMFLTEFDQVTDAEGTRVELAGSHHSRATYRHDISIGLAWGFRVRDYTATPSWAVFPDKAVSLCLADFFYQGLLVYRHFYLVVDGGRAYLPAPDGNEADGWHVSGWGHDFTRTLQELGHGSHVVDEYDRYFRQAGFRIT